MAKKDKAKASKKERRERRFVPQSMTKPLNIKVLGGLGAALLGAGAWAQFGRALMHLDLPPYPWAPWARAASPSRRGTCAASPGTTSSRSPGTTTARP